MQFYCCSAWYHPYLMGSDWIEKRNTQRDVKSALLLVKAELKANRQTILDGKQKIEREI